MSHKEEKNFCKSLLIIQPGAFGDILICAPIAKEYSKRGYKVVWPARKKFMTLLSELNYVTPVVLNEDVLHEDWLRSDVMKILPMIEEFDVVLNLADRGPHPTAQLPGENFEMSKYRIAKIPLHLKHTLEWTRNVQKENEIYNKYVKDKNYCFVHNTSSHKEIVELPPSLSYPVVYCDNPPGYNIYDWYKVIINAKEIYCTESSIWAFMDGIVHSLPEERYILSRKGLSGGRHYTISKYWKKNYLK